MTLVGIHASVEALASQFLIVPLLAPCFETFRISKVTGTESGQVQVLGASKATILIQT